MLKTAKVVGLNSDNEAALALICRSADAPAQPIFLAVILCSGEDAFSQVRQCLFEAESEFLSSSDSLSGRLSQVFVSLKEHLKEAEKLEVILCAVDEDEPGTVLYLLQSGEDLATLLLRQDKQTDLGRVSRGEVVSGIIHPGDRIILATQSLLGFWGKDLSRLAALPLETLEDEVLARLPEAEVCPMAAIALEKEEPVAENSPPAFQGNIKSMKRWWMFLLLGVILVFVLGGLFLGYQKLQMRQEQKKLVDKQKQILETKPEILQIYEVKELPLWLDLDLIKSGFSSEHLSLSLGKILLLDKYQKVVVTISTENKSPQILAGEDKLGEGSLASLNGDVAWIYSLDKGMVKADGQEVKAVIKSDKEWGAVADIVGFAGNLYVLDSGNPPAGGQVWKYLPIVSGYADKREYFKSETKMDLSGSKKMQIDGSIWILKESGEISRYTQGVPDYFSLSGLDKPITKPQSFFVSDQTDNLYILDEENNRLLVVDKKGAYKAQYISDRFKNFVDLVVDEGGKKVYLLDKSKIYLLELK